MSSDLKSPNTLATSLNEQIREAGYRLQNRRQLVRVCSATLGRTLYQRITAPAWLLWTGGGMGFLLGEFTRCQKTPSRDQDRSPDSGHTFFESTLNLIKLVNWGHALFTALPGAGIPPREPPTS
ncbi:MAG: hypothetical protein QG599_3385 [Pseudomonadota bacterium]|nr:hypothetical protein [Pseudomonadota bacterium]